MEKDTWIAEVLSSTAGMRKAAPREGLLDDILSAVKTGNVSARTVWIAAASIAALVALNLLILKSGQQNTNSKTDSPFYINNQLY